jgi:hypothetical protein
MTSTSTISAEIQSVGESNKVTLADCVAGIADVVDNLESAASELEWRLNFLNDDEVPKDIRDIAGAMEDILNNVISDVGDLVVQATEIAMLADTD